ncbi:PF06210 family protein [Leptospira weilii serovar Ranarum str. ICFT]|uniref:PF06210 family protein n=2 Tax=Leptospira weilii TaxID=28184 RepID=N1W962_9LEPT|nr:PF06210 family protein [Leptospira weilii serovar Ranarum str. ICFT]
MYSRDKIVSSFAIRKEIEMILKEKNFHWNDSSNVCFNDYNLARVDYVKKLMEQEIGSIQTLEQEVVNSVERSNLITSNNNEAYVEKLNLGDKIADKVAKFGGSWGFIISFFIVMIVWISANAAILVKDPFDPYPFILLNLILSCLAALQAPVIMMSQNRQEAKDRIRSENDYKINLKAEIEIRTLHEKVDHLLLDQWSKMIEIQEIQMEILGEISSHLKK